MKKRIAISLLCALSLSGCASFVSNVTGTAPVGTDSGKRSLGQVYIDSSIERTAKVNLYKLDSRFNQARVNIESFHGHVLLTGQVPDANLRQLAEDNMRAMSDVKAVHNFISIGSQIGYNTIMQDSWITTNTKGLLMRAEVVSASKVYVHTEDGVLYVMGKLNTAEIDDLNHVLEQVGNVERIVTLIDNVDVIPQTLSAPAGSSLLNAPETPVAIDPNNVEPTHAS